MLGYRIKLAPDDNGTVLVTCPALPEVTTFGADEADALRRAVGASRKRSQPAWLTVTTFPRVISAGRTLCACLP